MAPRPARGALILAAAASIVLSAAGQDAQLLGSPRPATGRTGKRQPGDQIFQTTRVHRIDVAIPATEWAVLQTSAARGGNAGGTLGGYEYRDGQGRLIHVGSGFGGYFPWAKADITVAGGGPGLEFKDAGIRYKGNLSFSTSSAAAPLFANFKLKFDVHGSKGKWDGEKTFNLHAGVVDTSKMREAVAYSIFRAAGVPAPRTAYAELYFTVPGVYQAAPAGLFTLIEDVNNTFLERVLPPGNGLLMKPEQLRGGVHSLGDSWSQYVSTLRPDRDATPHEQQRVIEFSQLVSQTDATLFRRRIGEYLDVDGFLRFIAINALIVNTDSYLRGGHNFYLYLDPADDKFRFLPWDQDLAMGARSGRGGMDSYDVLRPAGSDQPLIYWLLDDPAVMTRYKTILKELAASVFTSAQINQLIDAVERAGAGRAGTPRQFLEGRAAYFRDLVAAWDR